MTARGQILKCTIDEYHADPCPTPSLSSSIAKIVVEQSPLHAWMAHPRFGGVSRESTKAQNEGTLFHRLFLGKGSEIVVVDAADYKTKAAQAVRDEALSTGKTPVLAHRLPEVEDAVRSARDIVDAYGIRLTGESEVPVSWRQRVFMSDREVLSRAMFDHVDFADGLVVDVKKIACAHPDKCMRAIIDYRYDIQHAAYLDALRAINPGCAGRERFVFLFCEIEPPYAVTPVELDGQFKAMGERYWDRAVRTWDECMRSGKWPSYVQKTARLSPPTWAIAKAQDAGLDV